MQLQTRRTKKITKSHAVGGKRKIFYKNGETKIGINELFAPAYEQIIGQIRKKVGERSALPPDLSKGDWSKQALKVIEERYLVKDENLEPVETPDEMVWRVAWEVASAEARFGKKRKQVMSLAKEFYSLMVSREFLPNSPTLMNAGTGNGLQYSACFVLPVEDSMEGIFDALKYQAIVHKTGGGTGFAFSRLKHIFFIINSSSSGFSPVNLYEINIFAIFKYPRKLHELSRL
jgi:ribonucleotide reductase alpha subunit